MSVLRRIVPRSLANRTAAVLLAGLAVVQASGLLFYTLDRLDLQRLAMAQQLGLRIISVYRSVVLAPPDERANLVRDLDPGVQHQGIPGPGAGDQRPRVRPPSRYSGLSGSA